MPELVVVDSRRLERSAAHAVRPVAGGHKLGLEHPLLALADVANGRHRSVDADRLGFEADVAARVEARLDQVYDDLLLAVDEDRPPDERVEVDVVAAAVEVEVDAAMDERFAIHPPTHARRPQELRCAVLQHARAHPRLGVTAIALFQHDRPDAAVIPKPDVKAGEIPKAFVVLAPGAVGSAEQLMAYVTERVTGYKRVREVEFVDAIPKSPSGKILRRVLVERERERLDAQR